MACRPTADRGCFGVPLSEDEQRILSEIEQQFYEHDPDFARGVSRTTIYSHAGRNLKWATVGFVAGLVFMLAFFATSVWLGVVGFGIMLASALVFERNLRKMGRAGWQSMTQSMRAGHVRSSFTDTRRKLRDKFKREGE